MQSTVKFTFYFLLTKLDILCVCNMTAAISPTSGEVMSTSRVTNIFLTQGHTSSCGLVCEPHVRKIAVSAMYALQCV